MNLSPLELLLSKFPDAKPGKDGNYKAHCPAHNDSQASLSIGSGDDGRALLRCFAECDNTAIVQAVGLTLADLMPPKEQPAPAGKWAKVFSTQQTLAEYDYTDANSNVLYQSLRVSYSERNETTGETRHIPKDFTMRRADGKGGWIWKMAGVSYVLYRLPKVLKAAQNGASVFVCEGEKDVAAIEKLGFVATTNIGGAGKWKPEYSECLRGAHVVILPDNDTPGRKSGQAIAAAVYGVAASVRVLELPNLPVKGDVSDYLDRGGTAAALCELAKSTPLWESPAAIALHSLQAGTPPVADTGNDTRADALPSAGGKDGQGRASYEPWQIVALLRALPGYTWQVEAPDTNRALAARITMFLKGDLCYCPELGWVRYNGRHWAMDDKDATAACELVATLSVRVREEAAHLIRLSATLATAGRGTDAAALLDAAKVHLKHVRQVETTSFIEASLSLAANGLRVQWEAFAPKPWIFGFANGVWDRGEWREHRQSDFMLSVSPIVYDPDADRTEWKAVLDRMTGGDSDLARTLQQFAGYCVSGASHLRLLPWAYGPRGSGKSTLSELLKTLLGKESAAMEPDDVSDKSRERTGAKIWNKRLAVCAEMGEQRISPELLKQLSGGDTLPVRYLFKEAFDAPPRHVLLMVANDPPVMNAYDDALKARVRVLPLRHDLSLPEPLKLTGGARIEAVRQMPDSPLALGFAAWAMEGLAEVYRTQSVYLAPIVETATAGFWADTDPLTGFWKTLDAEALRTGIAKGALRELYEKWCETEGIRRPMQARQWTKACHAYGLDEFRKGSESVRCWFKPDTAEKNTDKTDKTEVNSKSYAQEDNHYTEDLKNAPVLSVLSVNPSAKLLYNLRDEFEDSRQIVDVWRGRIVFFKADAQRIRLYWPDNPDRSATGGGWLPCMPPDVPTAGLDAMRRAHAKRMAERGDMNEVEPVDGEM